mgnify:CR=1 FL=1
MDGSTANLLRRFLQRAPDALTDEELLTLLLHAGKAQLLRYSVHCTQADMLRIAAQNHFDQIIAYNSDFAPTKKVYEV